MTGPGASRGRRREIPATYSLHRGPVGVTHLLVSVQGRSIVLDPQVTGACVMSLEAEDANTLRNMLTEWLWVS